MGIFDRSFFSPFGVVLTNFSTGFGADFVFFGRILQFAIAAAGEAGLRRLWDVLSEELSIAMAQTGHCNLEDVKLR